MVFLAVHMDCSRERADAFTAASIPITTAGGPGSTKRNWRPPCGFRWPLLASPSPPPMALDPTEFLAHASLLMEAGGEAGYRSAINRAYYACHLVARDRLFGLDAARWEPPPRRPSHRAVARALWERPSTADAAHNLERLRRHGRLRIMSATPYTRKRKRYSG